MLAAKLKGILPKRLVPWVVQPELITLGLDLSPLLAEKRDILADSMAEELPA